MGTLGVEASNIPGVRQNMEMIPKNTHTHTKKKKEEEDKRPREASWQKDEWDGIRVS